MRLRLAIDIRGELFSAAVTFAAMLLLRLGSSVVMSRLLYPEAYGLLAILLSIVFAIEMLSDVGVTGFVIRHERADEQSVINTLWTLRFVRGLLNATLLFAVAPWIGTVYGDPRVGAALQVLSLVFVLGSFETLGYSIAARHKRSRITAYIELCCTIISTLAAIGVAYLTRNHWALVSAVLLQRGLMTVCSYFVFPEKRPRFQVDKTILLPLFEFSKFVMPASMLTLALTQYDKLVFLKLFDLKLMGLYGVGQNLSGTVSALVMRISQSVLYPRCAQWHRETPHLFADNIYTENRRMFLILLGLPAIVGGAAPQIIQFLYDPRWEFAGFIFQVMMIRVSLESMLIPSLSVLIAAGYIKGELLSSALRLVSMVVFSSSGYWLSGFKGFLVGMALEPILALGYITYKRYRYGLGKMRNDTIAVSCMIGLWLTSWFVAELISETSWWVTRVR